MVICVRQAGQRAHIPGNVRRGLSVCYFRSRQHRQCIGRPNGSTVSNKLSLRFQEAGLRRHLRQTPPHRLLREHCLVQGGLPVAASAAAASPYQQMPAPFFAAIPTRRPRHLRAPPVRLRPLQPLHPCRFARTQPAGSATPTRLCREDSPPPRAEPVRSSWRPRFRPETGPFARLARLCRQSQSQAGRSRLLFPPGVDSWALRPCRTSSAASAFGWRPA
jgi:hypothetical protein